MTDVLRVWMDRLTAAPADGEPRAVPAYVATMVNPDGTNVVVSGETAEETLAALVDAVLITETYDTWKHQSRVQGDET